MGWWHVIIRWPMLLNGIVLVRRRRSVDPLADTRIQGAAEVVVPIIGGRECVSFRLILGWWLRFVYQD